MATPKPTHSAQQLITLKAAFWLTNFKFVTTFASHTKASVIKQKCIYIKSAYILKVQFGGKNKYKMNIDANR